MAKTLITAKVFLEDAVYLKDKPERLGLVVKTWHDFDSGESDSEDEDSSGPLELQQVVVHWIDGSAPQTLHEDDLVVSDRSFSHGDVVKRSPNDIMSGSVIDVKVELDLEKVCPPMNRFYGIDAMHVDFCQEFVVNNHVIYDGWLGVIEEVQDEVTVLLNDSSVCVVKNSDDLDLRDQIHDQSCFFPDSLAPGHAVCGPSRVFKNADYLIGSYPSQKQGYVLRTEVTSITVNWLSFNPLALDQTPGVAPPPRVLDDFENIIVYKSVEQHCTFELMDRVKIVDKETLQALSLKEYCPYLKSKSTRLQCPDKTHNHTTKFATEEMKVIGTKTRVTVQWQDLSISSDVDSTTLVPYLNMDDQDVWPADYVLLKPGEVLKDEPGGVNFDKKKSDMLGIVQSVNARERTTLVKWFSEERDQGLEQVPEELSLYEIMSHPDLKFRMGDKVVVSREREQNPSSDIAPRAPSVDDILSLVSRGNEIFNELMREKQASQKKSVEPISPRSIERRGAVLLERYGVEGVEALDRYISETNKMASETVYWLVDRGDPLKPIVPEDVLANLSQHEKDVETIRTRLNWVGQIWKVYQDRPSALIRFMDGTMEEIPVGRIMVVEDDDEDDEDEEDGEEDEEFEEYDFDRDEPEEISTDDSWETDSAEDDDSMSDIEEHTPAVKQDENGPERVVEIGVSGDDATPSLGDQPTEAAEITEAKETTEAQETTETTTNSVQELETFDPLPEPEDMTIDGQYTSGRRRHSAVEQENWKSFLLLDETPTDHHFLQSTPDSLQSDKAWVKRIAKEHAILASSLPDGIRVRTFEDRMDLLRVLIQGPDHTPYRNALFLFDFKLPALFPSQLLISLQGLVLVPEPYYNEAGFEKFVGTKEAARNSELYNEKVYLLSLKTIQTILNNPPTPFQKEVRHFYFERKKLEQTVIEGLELIAGSEADMDVAEGQVDAGAVDVAHGNPTGTAPGPMITRISKGALKMLKKHIDTLSLYLEE
ncbi:hypothetical protein BGZ51_001435 [Haplosporangium sp. Z 767]|nr:hypothetical protein BGZ51_001435 [Haplosporangium sp. Z 767]KAF9196124.1 hypothetical protein BGZ50_002104 [Haplosporangium sp. Z 11]